MAGSRKTRSQLALPELDYDVLSRSPLRQARIALKQHTNTTPPPMLDPLQLSGTQEPVQDHDVPSKRPPSPLKDTVALRERELKRAKHDDENENESTPRATHISPPPERPSSTSSAPTTGTEFTPIRTSRAQSVPPGSATPIPHLDLNKVAPSPWRTPGIKLQITTVSMETIADAAASTSGHRVPPPDVIMATPTASSSTLPLPPIVPLADNGQSSANSTLESLGDLPPSSPLPSLPTSPVDEQPPDTDALPTTPRKDDDSSQDVPTSPLTPPPPTPMTHRMLPAPGTTRKVDAALDSFLRPKTPVASMSRLPRPTAAMAQPSANASLSSSLVTHPDAKSEAKGKAPSKVRSMKPKQPQAPIPLGGRMTRSASLRHQETKKKEELSAVTEAAKASNRPITNQTSLGLGPAPGPSTVAAAKTPGRRRSMSFSYAMPTTSSAAKSNPGSPTKPHSTIHTSSHVRSFTFSRPSHPPSSSLSDLNQALEKINLPPPSRPNTSMGFNRDVRGGDTDDDDDDFPTHSSISKDDADINMKSTSSNSSLKSAPPLKRSTTLGGTSSRLGPSPAPSKPQVNQHSRLMLPPPVPKSRVAVPSSSSTSSAAAKRINLQSGMVSGKPKGTVGSFGNKPLLSTGKPRIFGAGTLSGSSSRDRVAHRASKQSSLPVVEGSPVKGGACTAEDHMDIDKPVAESSKASSNDLAKMEDMGAYLAGTSSEATSIPLTSAVDDSDGSQQPTQQSRTESSANQAAEHTAGQPEDGKGPEPLWKSNPSRRASLAANLLSQSLSSLPQTPPQPAVPQTEGKGKGRAGLRSSSSTYPGGSSLVQGQQTAPAKLGQGSSSGTPPGGAHVFKTKGATGDGAAAAPPAPTLKVLKDCKIFVDVRTDGGDDFGEFFIEMLKGMGAKIMTRVGSTCTHIVYKNGLMSTLTRYRILSEPRPFVVGIAWVVECAEQRVKVDEKKFLVDLELVNVAGQNKRRRSMLPKSLSNIDILEPRELESPASGEGSSAQPLPSSSSTPVVLADNSPKGGEEDLTPLERARRRHNTIPNMFKRT